MIRTKLVDIVQNSSKHTLHTPKENVNKKWKFPKYLQMSSGGANYIAYVISLLSTPGGSATIQK